MANNLSVKIGANTADLEKNIERAKKTLEQYSRTAKQAKTQIEQNVSVSNQQVNAYQRVVKQLEKVNSGTLSTTQQQKVLTNQVKELKIQWNALTDDQRISGWGQSVANSLKAAESELETTKQKLESVSEQTKKTSDTSESYSSNNIKLTSVLGKLSIAIGGVEAAQKIFNGVLEHSQTLGDQYTNTMEGMRAATDHFYVSLANLDFTGLIEGLTSAYTAGVQYSQALDTMQTYQAAAQVGNSEYQRALMETRAVFADTTASAEQKQEALDKLTKATEDYTNMQRQEMRNQVNVLNADLRQSSVYRNLSLGEKLYAAQLRELGKIYLSNSYEIDNKLIPAMKGAYGNQKLMMDVVNGWSRKLGLTQTQILGIYAIYEEKGDEGINAWMQQAAATNQFATNVAEAERNLNRLFGKSTKTVSTPSTPKVSHVSAPKEKTYLEQLEEQNKKIQKQTDYITKNYDKIVEKLKIQKAVTKEYERQKELLEISATLDTSKIDTSQLKPVSLKDIIPKTDIPLEIKPVLNKKEMDKITKEAGDKEKKRLKEQADAEKEYANQVQKSISTVGNAFSTLGNAIGGTGGEIINTMGQMIGQVPGIIQAIQSITAAKEGEAIASGTAEGAKAPWFMQVAVIAGLVANIVATFASIGKFANGGIIQGASKIGDYNVARVNDGEMILNGSQQSNLFKILNSPIADQQQSISIASTRVRGQDIYISLKTFLKENPSKKL